MSEKRLFPFFFQECGLQLSSKQQCYPKDQHLLCRKCHVKRTRKSKSPQETPCNSPSDSPNVTPRCLPRARPRILRGRNQ